MSLYVKQWHFTEGGDAYDLTKIASINKFKNLDRTDKNNYVVCLDSKAELLTSTEEAKELIQALKQRELDIERIVNTDGNE